MLSFFLWLFLSVFFYSSARAETNADVELADVELAGLELADVAVEVESNTGVYRRVGADGVVEFNDYGVGEAVAIDVPPPLGSVDVELVQERQRDIFDVASVLANDRFGRAANRQAQREISAQAERERAALLRAADSVYFPARFPLFSSFRSNRLTRLNRGRRLPSTATRPGTRGAPGFNRPSNSRGNPRGTLNPSPAQPQQRRSFLPSPARIGRPG